MMFQETVDENETLGDQRATDEFRQDLLTDLRFAAEQRQGQLSGTTGGGPVGTALE